MGDEDILREVRFESSNGQPTCPRCSCDAVYTYRTRKIYKCMACKHQFSVTSGTGLHGMKISPKQLFDAFDYSGVSAAEMARRAKISPKTAQALWHRLRDNEDIYSQGRSRKWIDNHGRRPMGERRAAPSPKEPSDG